MKVSNLFPLYVLNFCVLEFRAGGIEQFKTKLSGWTLAHCIVEEGLNGFLAYFMASIDRCE